MFTRKDYLSGVVDHHTYYSQFVSDDVMQLLKRGVGVKAIQESKDEHFNDIPLAHFDALYGYPDRIIFPTARLILEANGTAGISPSDCVCTLKAAAQMIRDGETA